MTTDTTEAGLEALIVASMTGEPVGIAWTPDALRETQVPYDADWAQGEPLDYDR